MVASAVVSEGHYMRFSKNSKLPTYLDRSPYKYVTGARIIFSCSLASVAIYGRMLDNEPLEEIQMKRYELDASTVREISCIAGCIFVVLCMLLSVGGVR